MRKRIWYKSLILGICLCFLTGCNKVGSQETVSYNESIETVSPDAEGQNVADNFLYESSDEPLYEAGDKYIPDNKDLSTSDEMAMVLGYIPDEFDPDKEYNDWFDLYSSLVYDSGRYDNHEVDYKNDRKGVNR